MRVSLDRERGMGCSRCASAFLVPPALYRYQPTPPLSAALLQSQTCIEVLRVAMLERCTRDVEQNSGGFCVNINQLEAWSKRGAFACLRGVWLDSAGEDGGGIIGRRSHDVAGVEEEASDWSSLLLFSASSPANFCHGRPPCRFRRYAHRHRLCRQTFALRWLTLLASQVSSPLQSLLSLRLATAPAHCTASAMILCPASPAPRIPPP